MSELRNKWRWVVAAAWVLAAVSVASSLWMAWSFGFYSAPGLNTSNHLTEVTHVNVLVVIAAGCQMLVSLLFGCMFTMMNSIYQTSIDTWDNSRKLLYEKK